MDSRDELIAFNICFLYKEMNDKKNARKYFKRVVEIGKDGDTVEGVKKTIGIIKRR